MIDGEEEGDLPSSSFSWKRKNISKVVRREKCDYVPIS
jgi:hypothetical protein